MEYYVQADTAPWSVPSAASPGAHTALEEGMWQLNLQNTEGMEPSSVPYPERPGEPDCVYYMRTGLCGFGVSCRFNHPPNRKAAAIAARSRGEYPERFGQPECQYYLRTGTCKFGASCKYHHPRDKGGVSGRVQFNILGLPFRSGERECAYYMRTGSCKYGATCKFHHPQPATAFMPMPSSSLYAPAGSPSAPVPQNYPAALSPWPLARGPYLPSSRLQGPTSFASLIIPPQGIMPITGWNPYQGPVSPDGQQPSVAPGYLYGGAHQAESGRTGVQGAFSPYTPLTGGIRVLSPQAQSIGQNVSTFPERPGQPECQYYMKTGDCKFGATCRYHHPQDWAPPSATYSLSPMGLPLRPGAPPCSYYICYGICKFGPTCKFDHPLVGLSSSPSASSLTDTANVAYRVSSTNASHISMPTFSLIPPENTHLIQVLSKDSPSVSGEPADYDQLASKKSFGKVEGSVSSSEK